MLSYVLGICYIQVMDYDSARRAFATMYGVSPDSAASHLFLSRMLLRQGFDPIAEQEAKKALAVDPKLPMAHFLLGELYTFKSRVPEAISEFEGELAINPGYAATYYRLADAYTRVGRYEDAERLLQRSVWLDSTASGPYILMAKVLLHKKEPDMAKRSLDRALTMDPNNYVGSLSDGTGVPGARKDHRCGCRVQAFAAASGTADSQPAGTEELALGADYYLELAAAFASGLPSSSCVRVSAGSRCKRARNVPLVQPKPIRLAL